MLLGRVELPEDMMIGKTVYDMAEEHGPGGMSSVVETDLVPLGDLPAASTLAVSLLHDGQSRSRLAPPPDWGSIMKDYMVASEEIKEKTEATQPSPSPRLSRSLQFSEENLLASASSFQSQNLSVPEKKKKDRKSKGSEKKINRKKNGRKVNKATPIAADQSKPLSGTDTKCRSISITCPEGSITCKAV